MGSREQILNKLRQAKRPFPQVAPPGPHPPVVPRQDSSPAELLALFSRQAQKASCILHECATPAAAIEAILAIVGEETAVSAWDLAHVPLPGLEEALDATDVARLGQDASVRVGLTGVSAALAATGSLVLLSGDGRSRAASLLPPVHVAVVAASQIEPDLESWWAKQKAAGLEQVRQASNIAIITGPSRTADIAMQLVMGMHGPRELHLILLTEA